MRLHLAFSVSLLAAACAVSPAASVAEEELCLDAVAHVESCLGEAPAASACDPDAAEAVLATPCDELGDAKADGIFSQFLCWLGFESYCEPSAEEEPAPPITRTLYGMVQRLDTLTGAPNLILRLRRGDDVKTTVTSSSGTFAFGDLEPAEYELEVWFGLVRLRTETIDVARRTSIIVYVPFIP